RPRVYLIRGSRPCCHHGEQNAARGRRFVEAFGPNQGRETPCSSAAATETHICDKIPGHDRSGRDERCAGQRAHVRATIDNCSRACCSSDKAECPSSVPISE